MKSLKNVWTRLFGTQKQWDWTPFVFFGRSNTQCSVCKFSRGSKFRCWVGEEDPDHIVTKCQVGNRWEIEKTVTDKEIEIVMWLDHRLQEAAIEVVSCEYITVVKGVFVAKIVADGQEASISHYNNGESLKELKKSQQWKYRAGFVRKLGTLAEMLDAYKESLQIKRIISQSIKKAT